VIIKHIEKLLRFRKSTKNHDGRPPNNDTYPLSCLYFIKAAKATYFAWTWAQTSSFFYKICGHWCSWKPNVRCRYCSRFAGQRRNLKRMFWGKIDFTNRSCAYALYLLLASITHWTPALCM